jgi:hypothetical protein
MATAVKLAASEETPRAPELRIAFLFNHDDLHQVAHTAPIIPALQRAAPDIQIDILASSAAQIERVETLLDPTLPRPPHHLLRPALWASLVEALSGRIVPLRRISTLKRNLDIFSRYDAIVVPESTTTLLKSRFGLDAVKLIDVPHGSGDRSICLRPERAFFDLVLVSGPKVRDRLLAAGTIRPDGHAIIGYPKFDTIPDAPPRRFFDNGKPTVLYNPHFDPLLSSWYDFGEKVLNFFARQDRYNLIFAPHVMLFRRKLHASLEHRKVRRRRHLPERFNFTPNIRIDVGSEHSVDMSYTRAADIYLGDASSQIYEFLIEPRPAIFLNAHGADWRRNPDYAHWMLGPVLDDVAQLGPALDAVGDWQQAYHEAQKQAFRRTFSVEPGRSSVDRAAEAIVDFLARERDMEAATA